MAYNRLRSVDHDIWTRGGVPPVAEHLCIRSMLRSVSFELNMRSAKLDIVVRFGMSCSYNLTQHNGIRDKIQKVREDYQRMLGEEISVFRTLRGRVIVQRVTAGRREYSSAQ